MLNISEELKTLYRSDSTTKNLIIDCYESKSSSTPYLTITNENIVQESMKLSESICEGETLEIGNVISSQFEIDVIDISNLMGNYIKAFMTVEDDTYRLPLFCGYVDSAKLGTDRVIRHIVAYDDIYNIADTDVTSWFIGLGTAPRTMLNFRTALFNKIGLPYETIALPNDLFNVYINTEATNITARELLKDVCEINGCFGVINRNNKFEFRILNDIKIRYPNSSLYPSSSIYPGWYLDQGEIIELPFCTEIDYGEYTVLPINKVEVYAKNANNIDVKQAEYSDPNPTPHTGGFDGVNVYKILDNNLIKNGYFTNTMAQDIYVSIANNDYVPVYNLITKGLPYVEVGDLVKISLQDGGQLTFPVFQRTLTGIQNLKDVYAANGEEYYDKEFKF